MAGVAGALPLALLHEKEKMASEVGKRLSIQIFVISW